MSRALSVAVLAAALVAAGAAHAALKGDVNLDGKVDSADYSVLNQALAGTVTLTWEQRDAADVAPLGTNDQIGNGSVDSADALIFDQALQGNDVDGDGLDVAAEIGGTAATNGSPFLRDTDKDGLPDNLDGARGSFNANAAPAVPTLAITAATTTSLGGTVSACSDPDSLPYPNQCTQLVRVVAVGGSCDGQPLVAPVSPTSGTWSITGLASGVLYTVYARSSDGALTACSGAQTAATTPTGTTAVVPSLLPLASPTNTNPVNVSGFGAPGQQVRVFVNGVEQDFVRTFAIGNPALSPNPFVVPSSGAFTVPVVLDDGVNRISASGLSGAGAESDLSNEVSTKYENLIPRNTSPSSPNNPLRILQQPVPDDPNSEEVVAGRILVLTKGDMPGFTNEYYLDHHLEAKANALLVIGAGASLRFPGPTGYKRKIIVAGTLRTRGTAAARVLTYYFAPTATNRDQWGGIEIQSSSRGNVLAGISVRNSTNGIALTGTPSSRPDLEVRDSSLAAYQTTGIDVSTAGQLTVANTAIYGNASGDSQTTCTRIGIAATATSQVTVTDSFFDSHKYGVQVTDSPAEIRDNGMDATNCAQNVAGVPKGAAVYVKGAVGVTTISGNKISQNSLQTSGGEWWDGILVENSSPTVDGNYLRDCIVGVEVFTSGGASANPTIQNNLADAIALLSGIGNLADPNTVHGAVVLRDGAGGIVRLNHFSNFQAFAYGRGVFVKNAGSAPIEIANNELTHLLFGVDIENTAIPAGESISVHDNAIGLVQQSGIAARFSDATITSNFLRKASSIGGAAALGGIYLESTTARVENNSILDSLYGVRALRGTPEIFGNYIAVNYYAGIRVEATASGTLIRGNRIEENKFLSGSTLGAGIQVVNSGAGTAGTFVTIDSGNVISGNTIGVRIEGLANSATGQPVPIISGNAIYGNLSGSVLQNIQIVGYSTPTQTTLDFSLNWWNTTTQSAITQGIVYVNPPASGLQPLANIDFPHVVTAPNTSFFVGQLVAMIGTSTSRMVYFEPNLSATPQPVAALKFNVYDPAASVVARICLERDATCGAANALYSSTPQTFSVGAATINWNGADSSGKLVAPEAYQYALEATKAGVTQLVVSQLDDPAVEGNGISPPLLPGATYDGYRNDRLMMKYRNNSASGDASTGPMRVTYVMEPKDAAGRAIPGAEFETGMENYPYGTPIPTQPNDAKLPYLVWNSRNPTTAAIISGQTHLAVFPAGMKRNVIILIGSAPLLTSDTGAVNVTTDPWLVYDTFEQVAAIRYKVDRLSDVTISLLPPNSWNDTGAPTWQFTNVPANTAQLFEFRGHEVLGMDGVSATSARQLLTTLDQEGAFTFRVRAKDKVSLRTTETLVTVQVRH